MKWAVSLILSSSERIETRVLTILRYLLSSNKLFTATIEDAEIYGIMGEEITRRCENEGVVSITFVELLRLFEEEGQIIEAEIHLEFETEKYHLVILDSSIVDILGSQEFLPTEVLGLHTVEDIAKYM